MLIYGIFKHGFVLQCVHLLNWNVTVFQSNRICQDPLENFFGRQRQRGKVNENPSIAEFMKNTQALRVVNSTCSTVRGNCRGTQKRKKFLK